jgi:hypothetical protein
MRDLEMLMPWTNTGGLFNEKDSSGTRQGRPSGHPHPAKEKGILC